MDPVDKEFDAAAALYDAIKWLGEWAGKDLTRRLPLIIDSGRGMQAWIRLEDIVLDKTVSRKDGIVDGCIHPDTARKINGHWLKRLDDRLKVTYGCRIDTSVSDLPRVMRCPGTINIKTGRKAKFIHYTDTVYTGLAYLLSTIDEKYLVDPEPEVELEKGLRWQEVFPHLTLTAQQYLTLGHEEPGRHKVLFHTLKKLRELGVTKPEARRAVKRANELKGEDAELTVEEIRRIVTEVYNAEVE